MKITLQVTPEERRALEFALEDRIDSMKRHEVLAEVQEVSPYWTEQRERIERVLEQLQ